MLRPKPTALHIHSCGYDYAQLHIQNTQQHTTALTVLILWTIITAQMFICCKGREYTNQTDNSHY